jgi:GWxTD domain-containing protein
MLLRRLLAIGALVLGAAACTAAPELKLDPESRDFYETARLVMTGEESDIFSQLPDAESRKEFIADFWAKRDPDPTTEANEFKEEFEKRIDYANKHFNEGRRGLNTDRGRIYIYLGPPEKTDYYSMVQDELGNGPVLWWIYYTYDLGIEFRDARNTGAFQMVQVQGSLLQAIETAKLGDIVQTESGAGRLLNFEASYDKSKREIVVAVATKKLNFKEEENLLKADFDFEFFVYKSGSAKKEKFVASKAFRGKAEEVEKTKALIFTFPYDFPPGKSFLDVIVLGRDGLGKSRRIFTIRN